MFLKSQPRHLHCGNVCKLEEDDIEDHDPVMMNLRFRMTLNLIPPSSGQNAALQLDKLSVYSESRSLSYQFDATLDIRKISSHYS